MKEFGKKIAIILLCLCLLLGTLAALTGCGAACDGTYYIYGMYNAYDGFDASAVADTDAFVKLDGGKWVLRMNGETVLGTYEIENGRISMAHTLDGRELLDSRLIEQYGVPDGERVEVFGGRVEDGVLFLDTLMGQLQFEDIVFLRRDLIAP